MNHEGASRDTRDAAVDLPPDRILELLADRRRRAVVASLRAADEPVAVRAVASEIADHESDDPPRSADDDSESVRLSLYHCHVPKLACADVVDHDRDRNVIEPGANFEVVAGLSQELPGGDLVESESFERVQ